MIAPARTCPSNEKNHNYWSTFYYVVRSCLAWLTTCHLSTTEHGRITSTTMDSVIGTDFIWHTLNMVQVDNSKFDMPIGTTTLEIFLRSGPPGGKAQRCSCEEHEPLPRAGRAGARNGPAFFRRPQSNSASAYAVFFIFVDVAFAVGFFAALAFSFAANSCLTFAAMAAASTL